MVQPYPSGPHPTSFVGVPHSSPSRKVSYPTISLYPTFPLCPGELSLNSCTRRPPTDYTTAACLLALEAGGYWQGPRTTAHPSSSPFYASDKGRGKRERKKARDGEKIEGGGMREHHTQSRLLQQANCSSFAHSFRALAARGKAGEQVFAKEQKRLAL